MNKKEFYDSLTLEELIYFSERGYRPVVNNGYITSWEIEKSEKERM